MDIVVVGAGQAGTHIAQVLTRENHDVTVVDHRRDRLQRVEGDLDVRTVCEHGASPQVLEVAGAASAHLVAAVTDSDEVNLIAAATAHRLGARRTAARVYNQAYHGGGKIEYRHLLGIDQIISPQSLAALEIAKLIENPAAVAVETFGKGKVQMRRMAVAADSRAAGEQVRDLFPPDRARGVLVVAVNRKGRLSIPGPSDTLEVGDVVTVIRPAGRTADVRRLFMDVARAAEHVVIAGGGTTAMMLAETLEGRGLDVTLIEERRERCEALSRILSHTRVIHGDATRQSVLRDERVEKADVFVALCGSDEVNLMSSLQAKQVGVRHTIVAVNRVDYAPLVERVGIDHAVSPRILTGNRILTLVARAHISSVAVLEEGRAEVVELTAEAGAPAVGKVIGEEVRFPKGAIIGAVVRGEEAIVPRGGDRIEAGDLVIAFVLSHLVEDLGDMFCGLPRIS
jgi:trk system potassium uptake protein TrkA